jgi:hypothetical protein
MRRAPNRAIFAPVESVRVRLVVEIEPGDPVCGSAGREDGPQIPFEGMLGFLSLFDRLRARDELPGIDDASGARP